MKSLKKLFKTGQSSKTCADSQCVIGIHLKSLETEQLLNLVYKLDCKMIALRDQLQTKQTDYEVLQTELDGLKSTLCEQITQKVGAEKEKAQVVEQHEGLQAELQLLHLDYDLAISQLNQREEVLKNYSSKLRTILGSFSEFRALQEDFSEEALTQALEQLCSAKQKHANTQQRLLDDIKVLNSHNEGLVQEKTHLLLLQESMDRKIQSMQESLVAAEQALAKKVGKVQTLKGSLRGKTYECNLLREKLARSTQQNETEVIEVECGNYIVNLSDLNKKVLDLKKQLGAATYMGQEARGQVVVLKKENEELKARIEKFQRSNEQLVKKLHLPKPKNTIKEIRRLKTKLQDLSEPNSPVSTRGTCMRPSADPDALFAVKVQLERVYKCFMAVLNKSYDGNKSVYTLESQGFCSIEQQLNSLLFFIQEKIERAVEHTRVPESSPFKRIYRQNTYSTALHTPCK